LSNSHDGDGSVQVKFTPVRVVCHNTLTQAMNEGDTVIRVPHTRDLKERLEAARQNLRIINTGFEQIERDFQAMVQTKLDDARLAQYVALVFTDSKAKDRREHERVERDRTRACDFFVKGKGNGLPGVAGTLWAAYNGIAEMVDHGKNKRTPGQHLEHIWFGGGYGIKARAFTVAKKQMEAEWRS
jgi:phage/plasmid-like protein (TIGR03299 family)